MNVTSKTDRNVGKKAAIYARYSTDLQSERSTEDQIALCRSYADREGLEVVGSYHDEARSGASVLGRDGLLDLLDAARNRRFDIVVVEALDRLSRDMEDLAGLHKRLSFLGIESARYTRAWRARCWSGCMAWSASSTARTTS